MLGTRAGVPAAGDPASGYLVTDAEAAVVLDCGPGVTGPLAGAIDVTRLDAVVISHLHSDHCYDLLPLGKLLTHRRASGDGADPVRLFVPRGGHDRLRQLNELFPVGHAGSPLDRVFDDAFDVHEYTGPGPLDVPGLALHVEPVRHAIACCAVRVESAGASPVYSADTGRCDALVRAAAGADVLLCEATLREPDQTGHGHLSATEAGQAAAEAGVGHLVLTHFTRTDPDWLDALAADAATAFDGPVSIARPGARIAV